eukprot:scaffold117422_cov70-Phaeocystis_antarctica.AAC.5
MSAVVVAPVVPVWLHGPVSAAEHLLPLGAVLGLLRPEERESPLEALARVVHEPVQPLGALRVELHVVRRDALHVPPARLKVGADLCIRHAALPLGVARRVVDVVLQVLQPGHASGQEQRLVEPLGRADDVKVQQEVLQPPPCVRVKAVECLASPLVVDALLRPHVVHAVEHERALQIGRGPLGEVAPKGGGLLLLAPGGGPFEVRDVEAQRLPHTGHEHDPAVDVQCVVRGAQRAELVDHVR